MQAVLITIFFIGWVIQFVHMAVQKPPDSHWWGEWNWNILLRPTFTVNISFTSSVSFYSQTLLEDWFLIFYQKVRWTVNRFLTKFRRNEREKKNLWVKSQRFEFDHGRVRLKDAGPERFPKELQVCGSETEWQEWCENIETTDFD